MKDIDPKALYEEASRRLDLATANRLRLARRAATTGEAGGRRPLSWLPALATAAVLVLGLAWWLPQRGAPALAPVAASVDDAAVLSEVDEDTDMYAWLAEAPVESESAGKERSL